MSWEYEGSFLEQFDKNYRGTIGDQICRIIRQEAAPTSEIIRRLMRDKCWAQYSDSQKEIYRQLYDALETPAALDFIGFLIRRESMPDDEKQKLKNVWKQEQLNKFMADQPPTEKQLNYLAKLGVREIPKNKKEASDLISRNIRC